MKYLVDIVKNNDCDMLLFKEKRVFDYQADDNINLQDYEPKFFNDGYATFANRYATGSGFHWFRKKLMDQYNIFFRPDVYYSDDTLFMAKFRARVNKMAITEAPIYYYLQRQESVSHAVNYAVHCSCMYKIAKEYRKLREETFENNNELVKKRFRRAKIRAMQAFARDLCLSCNDKQFVKTIIKKAKKEKLYPFGVDWQQFRRDHKQNLKLDVMNWVFGFTSFEPYFWFLYCIFAGKRKKDGKLNYNINDFEDNY